MLLVYPGFRRMDDDVSDICVRITAGVCHSTCSAEEASAACPGCLQEA